MTAKLVLLPALVGVIAGAAAICVDESLASLPELDTTIAALIAARARRYPSAPPRCEKDAKYLAQKLGQRTKQPFI